MKLGKLAPKFHPKTLRLGKYLLPEALPDPPARVWREYKIPEDQWQMFGNDQLGDCTCACIAHMLMLVTAHTGTMVVPTLQDVITAYSAVSGYVPVSPDKLLVGMNDDGAAITDVLNYWQTQGIAGHKILGWASIDPTNAVRLRQAIYLFGGVDAGFEVPDSCMDQFDNGVTWDVVNGSPIDGGHSVPLFGFGSEGFDCCTWAKNQKLTNTFEQTYFDEAYAVITADWLNAASGLAPNTLNLDQLTSDLQLIKN